MVLKTFFEQPQISADDMSQRPRSSDFHDLIAAFNKTICDKVVELMAEVNKQK